MIGVLVTVICIEASGGSLTLSRLLSFSPFCAVNTLFATVNLAASVFSTTLEAALFFAVI